MAPALPFGDVVEAKSLLDRHRVLSPTAGVRVSPLCLGAMNFGDAWSSMMGKCDKNTTFEMLDFFFEQGGNFIDTANNYQFEDSENWIGEWMAERGNRDQIVLATKYTTCYPDPRQPIRQKVNHAGNHSKSLRLSVNDSLKKLKTDYIDLLYVHWWDFSTSIPELMQSLNQQIQAGKVLYLGISDTPAWVVSKANEYARNHGLRGFSVYQGLWSAATRDFEREIIPMAREEGMALCPWGALGGGNFKTDAQRAEQEKNDDQGRNFGKPSPNHVAISKVLEKMANEKNTEITSLALAYVRHKYPYVYPIIGGRKVSHLKGNIAALGLKLSDEEIKEIEDAVPFEIGFPMSFIFAANHSTTATTSDVQFIKYTGVIDSPPVQRGPEPHQQ